jgi:hypothetical protein
MFRARRIPLLDSRDAIIDSMYFFTHLWLEFRPVMCSEQFFIFFVLTDFTINLVLLDNLDCVILWWILHRVRLFPSVFVNFVNPAKDLFMNAPVALTAIVHCVTTLSGWTSMISLALSKAFRPSFCLPSPKFRHRDRSVPTDRRSWQVSIRIWNHPLPHSIWPDLAGSTIADYAPS